MDFLIVGNGMFGAATARYLASYAAVTVVGPKTPADGSGAYGAHHDEGRITGDLSRDIAWSELNRRARDGMTELDPALITPCGTLTATTRDRPGPAHLRCRGRSRTRRRPPAPRRGGHRGQRRVRGRPGPAPGADRAARQIRDLRHGRTRRPAGGRTIRDARHHPHDQPPAAGGAVPPAAPPLSGRTRLPQARRQHDDRPLAALREVLAGLLPEVRVRSWHTRRCAGACTAHRRPCIDILEPGRLVIALGGNGRGAQAADAVGQMTARLAPGRPWPSGFPQDAFRHVPAHAPWHGMTLLRDQAR